MKINEKNLEAFKGLKKETIASLSDEFLEQELKNIAHFDGIEKIEKEFKPEELRKITNDSYGRTLLTTYYADTYNTPQEGAKLLDYLHSLCKK